ncbi:HIT family protein [Erysipelothrix urinaevulpis]|uniref:HIT family protein n=1 Tax=Erysipelothrix urinaevulpis TaxID=2683717 RepID=UPI00135BDBAD|nr:HIT domain-containing protein [Erysipelothrix urinaevulpis]
MTIFSKIIDGSIPSKKIYEDDQFLAFLDISQASKGHTLIIPKDPTISVLTAKPDVVADINVLAQRLAKHYVEHLNAQGVNIITNANPIAGQTVDHYHVHVIPRYKEDELEFKTKDQQLDLDSVHKEILESFK